MALLNPLKSLISNHRHKILEYAFWGDLFDSRAAPRVAEVDWPKMLGVTVPSMLVGIVTIKRTLLDGMFELFSSKFLMLSALLALTPLALVAVCVKIIVARESRSDGVAGFGRQLTERHVYGNTQVLRNTAKLLLIPLLLASYVQIARALPNGLRSTSSIAGFICRADSGQPLAGASIEAVDQVGESVTFTIEIVDDDGFFFLDLDPWGAQPLNLTVSEQQCSELMEVAVHDYIWGDSCPAKNTTVSRGSASYPVWRLGCRTTR